MEASVDAPSAWKRVKHRLIVVAGAIAVGLVLQHVLGERLAEIMAHAEQDRNSARAELASLIRTVFTCACGLTAALGLAVALACRRPGAAERFPPPGLLAIGARGTITGPRARTFTRIGLGVGIMLLCTSLAAVAFAWYASAVLLACRA